jgi:hypothetical protein
MFVLVLLFVLCMIVSLLFDELCCERDGHKLFVNFLDHGLLAGILLLLALSSLVLKVLEFPGVLEVGLERQTN